MWRKFSIAILVLMGLARSAGAGTEAPPACTPSVPCHLRMREDTTLVKDNGERYRLPPGRFFDEGTFQELDQELTRLQNLDTRLQAENDSLRESLDAWRPGWLTVVASVLVGGALGVAGYHYLHD